MVILANTGSNPFGTECFYKAVYALYVKGIPYPIEIYVSEHDGKGEVWHDPKPLFLGWAYLPKIILTPPDYLVRQFQLSINDPRVAGFVVDMGGAVQIYGNTDVASETVPWSSEEYGSATISSADEAMFIASSTMIAPNDDTVWTVVDDNDQVDTWMVGPDLYAKVNTWPFTGFFPPVDNPPVLNSVKAGSAVPVKFSLGSDQGLNIVATGYPKSVRIVCDSGALSDDIEETVTAGSSSLQYDPLTGQYTYVWKTDKAWANTCRQFQLQLVDGTIHTANFKFK